MVGLLEKVLLQVLPFTAGQIASFVNDGTVERDAKVAEWQTRMQRIGPDARMSGEPGLERECRTYTRYLIGREPDAYIVRKYIECHELDRIPAGDAFDRVLIAASVRGPFWRARRTPMPAASASMARCARSWS